jgi:non-heme chloroperoxidase
MCELLTCSPSIAVFDYAGPSCATSKTVTEDLKKFTVPVLEMHGDDDQIVPYADSVPLSAKLLRNNTLKTYTGLPHGMPRPTRTRSTPI